MARRFVIPTYQLHKGTGQAKVRINGKDHYLGLHGTPESKQKYDDLVRKLLTERQRDELVAKVQLSNSLLVSQLIAKYLAFAAIYYRKHGRLTTEYGNIYNVLLVVAERHGSELATAFGPKKLKAIRDEWVAAGIVRTSINRRVDRVRRAWKWGVSEELVPNETYAALATIEGLSRGRTEAVEGKGHTPIPRDHIDKILPLLGPRVATMIRVQLAAAMRPGEVVAMTTGAIDRSGPVWVFGYAEHKTEHHGHERKICLGPKAQELLKPWLRANPNEPLFQPKEERADQNAERREARKTPLWKSHLQAQERHRKRRPMRAPRDRYDVASYRRAIHRACDEAGVPRWSPHGLRHAAASEIRRQFGEEVTRLVLGHSKIDTTRLYGEVDQAKAAEAMGKIG